MAAMVLGIGIVVSMGIAVASIDRRPTLTILACGFAVMLTTLFCFAV